ncbi:hypothetical protein [Methylobacterium sp. B1]|uniref:hypothetical protein n=1 Tax=Methylobacterium sp. B1 TaxID=91459 RepID=UPI00034DE35D|nr:hypothetical protein [Methylobacterium sp. B1]
MKNLGTPIPLLGGGTGAATATGALTSLGLNASGIFAGRNRLLNGNFTVNQRGQPSASTSYSAGVYILDRWKAGANGVTLSYAAASNGVDIVVTITAGTLVQVIEGSRYLIEGGAFTLSWTGTATARIYQGSASGSYAASPVRAASLTAATNTTVEFGTGTLSLVQFEPGAAVTVFERRDLEFDRCCRYFVATSIRGAVGGNNNGSYIATYISGGVLLPAPMASSPSLSFYDYAGNAGSVTGGNGNGNTLSAGGLAQKYNQYVYMDGLTNSNGLTYWWGALIQAAAEL